MKETKIASRYAKALFDFALEQKVTEQVKNDMDLIVSVCSNNKDFRLMLTSPLIYSEKKEAIIAEIFGKHIQEMTLQFLFIITRKRREAFIEGIARQFIELYKEYKNITTAELVTARELGSELRDKVIAELKNQTKGEIELIEKIKEELIGGFVLSYKDYQYDASIKKQIKKLRREFDTNLYIRGF